MKPRVHQIFFFVVTLWVACPATRASAQFVFQTEWLESQEEFFEGEYEAALFRLENAIKWLEPPANKALVIQQGGDYSVINGNALALKAQIVAALGEESRAQGLIARAQRKLADRRTYYIKAGANDPLFWLSEAFMDCVQGDIEYSRYIPPGIQENVKCLPKDLWNDDKRLERCRKHYSKAMVTLETAFKGGGVANPLAAAANGGGGGGGAPVGGLDYDDLRVRLSAKIALCLGRVLRLAAEREDSFAMQQMVLGQSESYYDQAEQRYRTRDPWARVIDPNTKFPLSLKAFEKVKQDNKDIAKSIVNDLKHEYSRTVIEWIYLSCDKAELGALRVDKSETPENRQKWVDDTDATLNKTADLCVENFSDGHPIGYWVRCAHARFELALARAAENEVRQLGAGGQKDEATMKKLERAKNRATAKKRNAGLRLNGLRQDIAKKLSPRHPLALDAALLALDAIPADDNNREQQVQKICDDINRLVELRKKGARDN